MLHCSGRERMSSKGVVLVGLAACVTLLLTSVGAAQSPTAHVGGVVRDAAGVPIAGAAISLTGAAGTRTTTSNQDGRFEIDAVVPGRYELKASGEHLREK